MMTRASVGTHVLSPVSMGTVILSILFFHTYLVQAQQEEKNVISDIDSILIKRTGDAHHGTGTGCVVKGSYCQCHYCKCEKGQLHCSKKGFGSHKGFGKRYCYGSMEGEYCHCDYCRCKHGYGLSGHPSGAVCTY